MEPEEEPCGAAVREVFEEVRAALGCSGWRPSWGGHAGAVRLKSGEIHFKC